MRNNNPKPTWRRATLLAALMILPVALLAPTAAAQTLPTDDLPRIGREYNEENRTCTIYLDEDGDGVRDFGESGTTSPLYCRVNWKLVVMVEELVY